jgi:hypothetical protein
VSSIAPLRPVLTCVHVAPQSIDRHTPISQVPSVIVEPSFGSITNAPTP